MLEKRFIKNQAKEKLKHQRIVSILSNTLLFLGTLVVISAIIYLLVNLEKSDSLVIMLAPFFVGGLGFIFISQLIKRGKPKLRR